MRLLILAAVAMLAAGPALAQNYYQQQRGGWNSQELGPYTYYNGTGSNQGWHGSSQQLGPYTYSHLQGPQGQQQRCTSQRLGNQVYTRCR